MSDATTNPSTDATSPSPARLRAEARKQKILSKGNDRLAKITGAMKSSHPYAHSEAEVPSTEPPDVDISKLDSTDQPPNSTNAEPKPPSSSTGSAPIHQRKSIADLSRPVNRPPMNSSIPPNSADPMLQMMKAMGIELPSAGVLPSDKMFGTEGAPNPMMQQAFAGLSGMQMGGQPARRKTWVDRVFPLLNLLAVVGLVTSAVFWWNPLTNYWRQLQGSGPVDANVKVDLKAEWEALYPSGSTPSVRQALGPAPVFWMFVTIELALQATRWMFNWGSAPPPGLLDTLILSLPPPYSTIASTAKKYFSITSSLIDDLCLLIFGVGCANGSRYTPSPTNWRELPIYTVILDRFMDGNPSNNDFYKSRSEWDAQANQLRHGGDIEGFAQDRVLDYIYGMGYRTIYIAGTPWLNMPWQSDGYSALDFTLLDPHFGTLSEWRSAIDRIHSKGMYVMLDTTTTTLSDFLKFKGNSGKAAPFNLHGYEIEYKTSTQKPWNITQYAEFQFTNTRDESCRLPKLYNPNGSEVVPPTGWDGCYAGDFDQFGDSSPAGKAPAWQDQLTKYSGVQDRLREWDSGVAAKLNKLACMAVKALDMDALRVDKATQQSLEFMGRWGGALRSCAKELGKTNFFITGEISDANTFGSLYIGRGRQPTHYANLDFDTAALVSANQSENFMRPAGENALDSAAFHYSIYRSLTRFLGMDGELDSPFDVPVNWVEAWRKIVVTNDFLNQETQLVDPRHLYGTTNQDNFRWASLINGTEKFLLGQLVTNLIMPGIPFAYYGEEQNLPIFDSQANDYLYGRQPMSSSRAWQVHGCYKIGSKKYPTMPLGKALTGCQDDWNSLDHYDPTSATRNMLAHFAYLRSQYSSLQDGFNLTQLGNWTTFGELPASSHTPTEWGMWSITRSPLKSQKLSGPNPDLPVWILYSNVNQTTTFNYDCSSKLAILSPYPAPTTVRNLLFPYETYDLDPSATSSTWDDASPFLGCLKSISMDPFSYKVLVPTANWIPPQVQLVGFTPGHDARILSQADNGNETIPISISFSEELSCEGVSSSLSLNFSIDPASQASPRIDMGSVNCTKIETKPSSVQPAPPAAWQWSGNIVGAPDGVYELILNNVTGLNGLHTNRIDHLLFRKGRKQNPITFHDQWYSETLLENKDGKYILHSDAPGADLLRYSTDFGNTYSNWTRYSSQLTLPENAFSISKFWEGDHVRVQYWSRLTGSAAPTIDGDINFDGGYKRRFPQLILRGSFNKWGYDEGIPGLFTPRNENMTIDIITSWPHEFQLAVFEARDKVFYGDVDHDGVLDLLPPNSQARNFLTLPPPTEPFLGWRIMINPVDLTWGAQPVGHQKIVIMLFILLLFIPPSTALLACWLYQRIFYKVKYNQYGFQKNAPNSFLPFRHFPGSMRNSQLGSRLKHLTSPRLDSEKDKSHISFPNTWPDNMNSRRKVMIATLEYEIIDWGMKVKIGGLGVMSSLMGKAMEDVDLLWVIPKVNDLEYPEADPAPPIPVVVFGETYLVECQIHQYKNITYFLLDSPVFRANTKANPYPARMDDLSSAIFYSYWNQSIAEICRRTPDLTIYHINDYHGALAPLYLLPKILPVSLSLHNAEFQGQWPLGTQEEEAEVCRAFNLPSKVISKYARYGSVFNLLHAAASYISQHQNSVGVAGVSEKYGKRSWARYPVLWTLKTIEPLPNPDPTDVESLDASPVDMRSVQINREAEAKRPTDKRMLQEWSGLQEDPKAQVFVFVGRWSFQKGVDLIADVFPHLLEKRKDIQLIAIGPVIDLYGKLAALKLSRLMEIYPGRVYSRPQFTALPDFVFSGGDFALIPSRDEPFGLVAVEFGRKGVLGVGSRLGGLGLMPGWWFPVESDSTVHLHSQFTKTIQAALSSPEEERAVLRARSAHQRFPVLEWRIKMEDMHARSVRASRKYAGRFASKTNLTESTRPKDLPHGQGEPSATHPPSESNKSSSSTGNQLPPFDVDANQTRPALEVSRILSSSNTLAVQLSEAVKGLVTNKNGGFPNSLRHFAPRTCHDQVHGTGPSSERAENNDQEILNSVPTLDKDGNAGEQNSANFLRVFPGKDDKNSPLNQAVKDFTDEDGKVSQEFIHRLEKLNPANSQAELCIAKYIVAAHKAHFNQVRKGTVALAKTKFASSPTLSVTSIIPRAVLGGGRMNPHSTGVPTFPDQDKIEKSEVLDVTTAMHMNLWQIRLQHRVFGWPIYTIILAVGQILGATSFQLSLLSGTSSNGSIDFYVIGAVNILGSFFWYGLSRKKPATWSLSMPWIFFGLAFVFIGLPSLSEHLKQFSPRHELAVAASAFYSFASSAGFLFFSSNFGEEAGGTTDSWVRRACIVQGTQQVWVGALWYWGFKLQNVDPTNAALAPPGWINAITLTLGAGCFFIAYILYTGLPKYYRNVPGTVPNFTRALFRRKLVLWYLAAEILRNYWLSGPYGRNWNFLWTRETSFGMTLFLLLFFFVGVWGLTIWGLSLASKTHTWLVAIFAIGLGAPRWCQMLWGTSSVASYISWGGIAGPHLATSLWLWLGVLDAVQSVGLGMILLQTLSRVHVAATLCLAQIIGSTAVLVARATAPNRIGPGGVFPDLGLWNPNFSYADSPLANWPFWIALICQLIIVAGYFILFRREQLSKP
ncbi:hypothetical protein PCASD_04029 [Puccinia coronata f. sp. avenae]|uniref:alpha-1,3-glucan synthase n=1 Tax=Puccinia coronata f. sp. avenae TaxID=200324 RepID=A0A2N5V5G5_9BASI|nr:hypothetical protein PCASD_04029 [Puccinia coronata f. sp. avenae]